MIIINGADEGTTSKGITFDEFNGVRVIQLVGFVGVEDYARSTKIFGNTAVSIAPRNSVFGRPQVSVVDDNPSVLWNGVEIDRLHFTVGTYVAISRKKNTQCAFQQ